MYRPYKFLIQAVIQEVSDDGEVLNEFTTQEPTAVFGIAGLQKFTDNFERNLIEQTSGIVRANAMPVTDGRIQ